MSVSVVQLLVVIGAAVIAYHQVRSHIDLRRLQSTVAVLRYLENKQMSRARWFAYKHHERIDAVLRDATKPPFDTLATVDQMVRELSADHSGGEQFDIHDYLYPVVALNIVGYMIKKRLVDQDIVSEHLASTFLRTWEAYGCFIKYRRTTRFSVRQLPPSKYGWYLQEIAESIDPSRH